MHACGFGSASDVTILRLPNAELPAVPPFIVPPKGRWPPRSLCGGTAPGFVAISDDCARLMRSSTVIAFSRAISRAMANCAEVWEGDTVFMQGGQAETTKSTARGEPRSPAVRGRAKTRDPRRKICACPSSSAADTTATLAAMSVVAGVKRERPDDPSTTPSTGETSAEPLPLPEDATPLQREVIHARHERAGLLRFRVYQNDGAAESLIALMHCKSIYGKQLPKMPKEYIVRLVLDRSHKSLACEFQGQVVGGVTYRPHATGFAEIAFCAVSETHQVQGYGTRMMNQLKEQAKREGIQYFLTYADNHAIGYFRKQGFQKQVTMKRERWLGYIKDYDGGTLMECAIEERLDYLTTRAVVDGQRQAIVAKVNTLSNAHVQHDGLGGGGARARAAGLPHSVPGLAKTSWAPAAVECTVGGRPLPLAQCLGDALTAIVAHDDAWPFRQGVSTKQAPDYYEVVKDPIDLSMIQRCARAAAQRVANSSA